MKKRSPHNVGHCYEHSNSDNLQSVDSMSELSGIVGSSPDNNEEIVGNEPACFILNISQLLNKNDNPITNVSRCMTKSKVLLP